MAQTKKTNVNFFAKMHKDLSSTVEKIRARQDEKQAILNQFDSEGKRFFFGKISEKALASSVKKANQELKRLNNSIREAILYAKKISDREIALVASQVPTSFKATLSGISGGKMKAVKRKPAKKKTVKKKSAAKKKPAKKK